MVAAPINFQYMQIFDVDEIKRRADCRDVARWLLGEPAHNHGKYVTYNASIIGRPEKTDSLQVYANGYKDFGDGSGGDVIKFAQLVKGCDFPAALHLLNDYIGGALAIAERWQPAKVCKHIVKDEKPTAEWQAIGADIVTRAERCLWSRHPECDRALDYLRCVRGLSNEQIKDRHFGYIPAGFYTDWIKPDGKKAWINAGITIPWYASDGTIFKLNVRCRVGNLAEHLGIPEDTYQGKPLAKYIQLAGGKSGLYVAGAFNADLRHSTIG